MPSLSTLILNCCTNSLHKPKEVYEAKEGIDFIYRRLYLCFFNPHLTANAASLCQKQRGESHPSQMRIKK